LSYGTELNQRIRRHLNPTNDSWRVDETYIRIKGAWKYLYRAVDSAGDTLDFTLSAKRDRKAAARFFRQILNAVHTQMPRVINVGKNAAYPPAVEQLQTDAVFSQLRVLGSFR
jgi:transposase-like protein